ncbi:MAG: tetratricopeptide repeat protein [Terriglobia bacterium]|jgi:TPR repeat protein
MHRTLLLLGLLISIPVLSAAQTWTYQGDSSCFRSGDSVQCFDQGALQSYVTDQRAFDSAYQNGQAIGQGVALLLKVWMQHHHQLEVERTDLREQINSYYDATFSLNDEITDELNQEIDSLQVLARLDPARTAAYEQLIQSSTMLLSHLSQMRPMTERNLPGILAAKDVKYLTSNRDLAQKFYSQAGEASKRQYVFIQFLLGYVGLLQSQQTTSQLNGAPAEKSAPDAAAVSRLAVQAEAGDAESQFQLAEMYRNGSGLQQDLSKAAKLMESAAMAGYAGAEFSLGEMYEDGEGVLQDFVLAHAWYNLAALHGVQGAKERRNALASHMTPEQISDAQKRAAQLEAKEDELKQKTGPATENPVQADAEQQPTAPLIQTAKILSSKIVTESTGTTVTHNPACDNPQTAFMKGFCSTAGTQTHNNTRSYVQVIAVIGDKQYTLVGDKIPPPGIYDVHFINASELDLTGKAANGELHSHRFKVVAIDASQ